jgi:hypothetical protein
MLILKEDKKRKMKKAQFFIIAALIGIVVIFSFFSVSITKKEKKPEKIYDLNKNFKFEAVEVIAKGKANKANIDELLDNATRLFLKYGLTEDPRLEFVYIYGNATNFTVFNFADENVTVGDTTVKTDIMGGRKNLSSTLQLGEIKMKVITEAAEYPGALNYIKKSFQNMQTVNVKLGNQTYSFVLGPNEQFYLLIRLKAENETFIVKE